MQSQAAASVHVAPWSAMAQKFGAWYERESVTANYDLFLRLPALLFFGTVGYLQFNSLADLLTRDQGLAPSVFAGALAARSMSLVVVVVFAALTLIRSKAVARSKGLWPRVAAILGSSAGFAFIFTTRAEPSLAWDVVSASLSAVGALLTAIVVLRLGRSFSTMPEARRLVTEGAYRIVRHPLYAVEEIAIIGVFLQFRSLPAAAIVLVHLAFQIERMRNEEKVLTQSFPEYTDYARRTARLVPGVY